MDEPVRPTSGGDRVRRTAARHGLAQLGLGVPPPPLVMLDQGLVLVAPYPCLPSSRGSWGAGARVGSLSDSSLYAPRRARPWSPRRHRPHLVSVAARARLNRLTVDNEPSKSEAVLLRQALSGIQFSWDLQLHRGHWVAALRLSRVSSLMTCILELFPAWYTMRYVPPGPSLLMGVIHGSTN
ncbi:stearoyl-acyl-carrier-protein desaturase2 [Zea mays]|jgi:hypothetical protein|uniref:Stearoyl-acyl-carrier-protein desaturase2 n=1 Tax=Zea mays TaxID=4577 RepID=A0A1D6G645_MAIZE|nr:stearoyl-acyl-carrier-protein desaturase2 [Zea mays]